MAALFVMVSVFLLEFSVNKGADAQEIRLGSSISPITPPTSWPSPSGLFEFGFYRQGDGFAVGVWLVGNPRNTIVWTANRDDPPVSSNSTLHLTDNGKLLLKRELGQEKLIANISTLASSASMLDSGNLVLSDSNSYIIWSTFSNPTDTILGGQNISSGNSLVSSESNTSHRTGRFCLNLQTDGNLVAYPVDSPQLATDSYWSTDTYKINGVRYLNLNESGFLCLRNFTGFDKLILANTIDNGSETKSNNKTIVYRATLDADGIFRLYSHGFDGNGTSTSMSIEWSALRDPCKAHGVCGFNSFCTVGGTDPQCICFPGFDFINQNQKLRGCYRTVPYKNCVLVNEQVAISYEITSRENMELGDHPYFMELMKKENCCESCLNDCYCGAALYANGSCSKFKLPLRYGRRTYEPSPMAFFKTLRPTSPAPPLQPTIFIKKGGKKLVISLGSVASSCVAIAILCFSLYRYQVQKYTRLSCSLNQSELTEEVTLRTFSYEELEKATEGFKEELGSGSTGAVYKGALFEDKKIVAVKRLDKVVGAGEREFRAEMNTVGRTHHRNLVRLLGFCVESSRRLLVYEYMRNGSLAALLFKAERPPLWKERMKIALDVARGILYLHEECKTAIIHCDIKPQNILMDETWTAKISDFGLAKLLMPYQTRTFTRVRGTRGYLAPEWQKNDPISVKADVYSFGIMLLEIICCRSNLEIDVSTADEIVLSSWVYNCFVTGELGKLVGDEEVEQKTLERMVKLSLWCIQEEPALRPSMKDVILIVEGIKVDVPNPPSPIL